MKTRILITGINGLIGWNLFRAFEKDHHVSGTYRRAHADFDRERTHRIDIENIEETEALFRKIDPQYLIHAWNMCDLDICEELPAIPQQINVENTRTLLEIAKKLPNLKKFIYMSTEHVFSGEEGSYTEKDPTNPKHVYGKTKAEAEKLVQRSKLPHLIIRPGLVIGESVQGNKGPRDFLFSRIRAQKPLHLFTDEWRTPIDAGTFVEKATGLVLSERTGIVHIAGKEKLSRYELGKFLAKESGLSTEHIHPRLRKDDKWAHIRPKNLSLGTIY